MKVIVYTRPTDGGISIVHLAPNAKLANETDDEFITRIRQLVVPVDALNVQIVDDSLIPVDRTNRNAWEWQ